MKIAFAGSPESAAAVLRSLAARYDVVAVLTKEDAPVGRKRVLTPSAIATVAAELGIKVLKRNRPTVEDARLLRELGAEICVVVAFGALLSQEVLNQGPRFVNVHFSLLPKFRGAAPVQRTILSEANQSGVSIFEIDAGLDTGPVLAQVAIELDGTETTPSLLHKLTEIAIPELMRVIDRDPTPAPQQGVASYAPKVSKMDGRINSTEGLGYAYTRFRALAIEPGVWFETSIGNLSVINAELVDAPDGRDVKSVTRLTFLHHMNQILVTDGSSKALKLIEVQPSGKPKMLATDWWRGLREVPEIV